MLLFDHLRRIGRNFFSSSRSYDLEMTAFPRAKKGIIKRLKFQNHGTN
jgi:hypothetical protein